MLILNRYFPNAMIEMSSAGAEQQEVIAKEMVKIMQKYYSFVMILLIPVYAIISRLVFVNRKEYNFLV